MNNNLLKEMIRKQVGSKFFVVEFIKKDNTRRRMVARLGVKKGVNGVGRKFEDKDHQLTVYDVTNKGHRIINLDTLKMIQCGKSLNWSAE